MSSRERANTLPYRMLAGVVPCRGGWLVQAGRLHGVSLYPVPPVVMPSVQEVLDWKPAFEVIAMHIPIGLPAERGPRACDREARALLKWPRSLSISTPPSRPQVESDSGDIASQLLPWIAEAAQEIASYNQRVVHEVHPELSFFEMNDGAPMRYSKHKVPGREERRALLISKMQNIVNVVDLPLRGPTRAKRLDACACLWTARRLASRGAAIRLPDMPEWDDEGLRMEVWR